MYMFEADIIDSTKERKETSFFNKVYDFAVTPFTKFGGLILAGTIIYFTRINSVAAYFLIMMGGMLLIVFALFVQYAKNERINMGRLTIEEWVIRVRLNNKETIFAIDQLKDFTISNFSNADESYPLNETTWVTFIFENSDYKYEIANDSDYTNKKLDDIATFLKSRYDNFNYINPAEKEITSEQQ